MARALLVPATWLAGQLAAADEAPGSPTSGWASDPVLQPGIVTEVTGGTTFTPLWRPAAGSETAGPADDPVLQPGIVREVPAWQRALHNHLSFLELSLQVEGYYDDNVFILPSGSEEGDFVWEIVPLIGFESSRPKEAKRHYFRFGYDPQLLRFSKFQTNSAENHRGFVKYRFNGPRGNAGFDHRSAQFSGTQRELEETFFDDRVDADLGRRTEGSRHYTKVYGDLEVGGDTTLGLSVTRFSREFTTANLVASDEMRAEAYVSHRILPKVHAGLGSGIGRFDSDGDIDVDFSSLLGRVRWEPTTKLACELEAGLDFREVHGVGDSDKLTTPILKAAVEWSHSSETKLSLEGFQRVGFSAIGESVRRTGIRGSFRQRLLPRTHYTLRGGYEHGHFESLASGTAGDRKDDYFFIRNGLNWNWDRISVELFHEFRRNKSNLRSDFERNQGGFGLRFEY